MNLNKNSTDAFRDFLCSFENSQKHIGNKICFYDEIDSTNTEAKRKSYLPEGTVFVAKRQTAGRGRRGNNWISDDDGLWMSILLKPQINPDNISCITLAAGLAVCKAIPDAKIKWPNDIVLDNKKVCGILTELITSQNNQMSVVTGIGVNVNTAKFDESIEHIATSVFLHTGKVVSKQDLFKNICAEFEKKYSCFINNGFEAIREEYIKNCATIGREVVIKYVDGEKYAVAESIDNNGALVVKNESGTFVVNSGEVSVRGLFGYI